MNLILSHFTEKKFDFISLKLLSFSISFHLMKKKSDSVSSHQKKTDSVSSHQKKILSHSDSVSDQNQNETENSDFSSQYIV